MNFGCVSIGMSFVYKVPIKCPCIGEVTAGSFQEVLESKRDEYTCYLPKWKLRENSWWRKHGLREGVAASPSRANEILGAHTWPIEKDVGCLCQSCLWYKPSRAKSAWAGVKPRDVCLGCLSNSSRVARAWHCGFKAKCSPQCCDWSEKRNGMASGWRAAMSAQVSWEADGGCQCQVSSPGATAHSQQDCAVPGQSNAAPRLGPLDIVVLQINNRVWAADVACNVVSQVFQRAWCWAMGKAQPCV